jgi:hypothetical protein
LQCFLPPLPPLNALLALRSALALIRASSEIKSLIKPLISIFLKLLNIFSYLRDEKASKELGKPFSIKLVITSLGIS